MVTYAQVLSLEEWQAWTLSQGFTRFTATQIADWLYKKKKDNPLEFTNLSMATRRALMDCFQWQPLALHATLSSEDGSEKFLLKTVDGFLIEMVLMPYSQGRTTLCISCQVGCQRGCKFCQTGKMGFGRNLTLAEILYQHLLADRLLQEKGETRRVTHIVFMGMGEPLDNYEVVVTACRRFLAAWGGALSASHITLSTAGVVPHIEKLGRDLPVRLAISLHSADEATRTRLMPINKEYPLPALKEALLAYPAPSRYGITFEYLLIAGVNDSLTDAKKLVHYLHGLKAKVNLIPFNHFPGMSMEASSPEAIKAFQSYLSARSIPAPVRYSRGRDISGACGQLAAKGADELAEDVRLLSRLRRSQKNLPVYPTQTL